MPIFTPLLVGFTLVVGYFVTTFARLLLRNFRSPLRALRGPPPSSFFMGHLREMHNQENNDIVARWEAQYGKTFVYRGFVGGYRLMTSDPVTVAHILGHAYEYPKPDFITDTLANMVAGNEGLLTSDGKVHKKQRRILTPAFSASNVKSLTPVFWAKAVELRDIWQNLLRRDAEAQDPQSNSTFSTSVDGGPSSAESTGLHARQRTEEKAHAEADDAKTRNRSLSSVTVDALDWLARATLDVIGDAGFGYHFNSLAAAARRSSEPEAAPGAAGYQKSEENELARAFAAIFDAAQQFHIMTILLIWFPALRIIGRRKGKTEKEARATMRRIGLELIEERMAAIAAEPSSASGGSPEKAAPDKQSASLAGRDLLSVLLRSNLSSNPDQRLSRNEILCQVSSFLAAGHETTASALTWTLYALARAPAVQAQLRTHLRSIPVSSSSSSPPTVLFERIARLPYLECVVREALRLHAPVCSTMRVATADDVVPVSEPYVDRAGQLRDCVRVRRGDIMTIPFQAMNRAPDVWGADAREFRPERWAAAVDGAESDEGESAEGDGDREGTTGAGARAWKRKMPGLWSNLMTFGNGNAISGHRACIGYRFSLVEMKIFLFVLLRDLEFSINPSVEIEKRINIVTRPLVKSESDKGNQMPLRIRYIPSESS
ncbi:hypothetical protein CERSUDRAFT_112008 [Gelatoporia subvermispora B]|uniref:Cytochrome P450 n=1 Tax=Ceriporiopsis subvermispora (strain B) TaxID=914234 RepID=M2R550_CERS8|nr:hypothetical protein CERSUDRAFT_112008 [Gelatoporia subvermispora B]